MRIWSVVLPTLLALGTNLGCRQPIVANQPERLFVDSPAAWVPPLPALRVSEDQEWAVFGRGKWLELVNLETGRGDDERERGSLETVTDPYWSHDGRSIGYTVGLPRAADAPLNMDVDVVALDENARPISSPIADTLR